MRRFIEDTVEALVKLLWLSGHTAMDFTEAAAKFAWSALSLELLLLALVAGSMLL